MTFFTQEKATLLPEKGHLAKLGGGCPLRPVKRLYELRRVYQNDIIREHLFTEITWTLKYILTRTVSTAYFQLCKGESS